MEHYGLGGYQLAVIQGEASDSLLALSSQQAQRVYSQQSEHQKLLELSADNAALTQQLNAYTRCEEVAEAIRSEMAVLFPAVHSLSLARTVEVQRDTTATRRFVTAVFAVDDSKNWTSADATRFQEWLKTRLSGDSIVLLPRTQAATTAARR